VAPWIPRRGHAGIHSSPYQERGMRLLVSFTVLNTAASWVTPHQTSPRGPLQGAATWRVRNLTACCVMNTAASWVMESRRSRRVHQTVKTRMTWWIVDRRRRPTYRQSSGRYRNLSSTSRFSSTSGVFRIAVRGTRRRRRWEWWGVEEAAGPPPQKNIFLTMISLGAFWQFLTGRKHGQSLEALGHGFYSLIAKRTLQKQRRNDAKKLRSDYRY